MANRPTPGPTIPASDVRDIAVPSGAELLCTADGYRSRFARPPPGGEGPPSAPTTPFSDGSYNDRYGDGGDEGNAASSGHNLSAFPEEQQRAPSAVLFPLCPSSGAEGGDPESGDESDWRPSAGEADDSSDGVGGYSSDSSDSEWSHRDVEVEPHPFAPERVPGAHVRRGGGRYRQPWTPLDVWEEFLPRRLLRTIVTETNRYAEQLKVMPKPSYVRGPGPWPMKFLANWTPVNEEELRAFFGLRYIFGLIGMPSVRNYWRTNSFAFHFPRLAAVMPRARFEAISRCLHFVDNARADELSSDKFWKVRPLLDALLKASKKNFQPWVNLAVDEQMQTCNNSTCPQRFCPPRKKTNGIKIWSICDTQTGYMVTFRMAVHRGPRIEDIVLDMADDLDAKGHWLFMDNLFTKPSLFRELRRRGFNACGTWRSNFQMPEELKPKSLRRVLEKGDARCLVTRDGLVGIAWHDSVVCNLLTTDPEGAVMRTVSRRERGHAEQVIRSSPVAAISYNRFMGAVDRFDALRASYTTSRACRRWYLALLVWFLDSAAVQSMIVYNSMMTPDKKLSHESFIEILAEGLLGGAEYIEEHIATAQHKASESRATRKRRRRDSQCSGGRRCARPFPEKRGTRRDCKVCSKRDARKLTCWRCKDCHTHLHPGCFAAYHEPL